MVNASVITGAHFDGDTYSPGRDHVRLTGQLLRVFNAMKDGRWRTLGELSYEASGTEASVSARLRDLRKAKFGGLEVERRAQGGNVRGLYEYRLVIRD